MSPTTPGASPPAPDFRSLDFARLWAGREKVTAVERYVVREALAGAAPTRVLEIGSGEGRLSSAIQDGVREFVASDVTPEFLERVRIREGCRSLRVAANVYHLPFVNAAFSGVVMVRVYGFLARPLEALQEIRRVMVPGGLAVVSYNPRPTVATLADDLKVALHRARGERMQSMTFTRRALVAVRPSSFPAWSGTRREFRRTVESAGLVWHEERPTGLEEYVGLRRLPTQLFCSLTRAARRAGGFPTRFATLRRPTEAPSSPVEWSRILACPACRFAWGEADPQEGRPFRCPGCGREWNWRNSVLDARW